MNELTVTDIERRTWDHPQTIPRTWERKELVSYAHIVCGKNVPVQAKWYTGRSSNASTVYCLVWLGSEETHNIGYGTAGGYGYDKVSAALEEALARAGVSLSHSIAGTGRNREALLAVADYFYPDTESIFVGNV